MYVFIYVQQKKGEKAMRRGVVHMVQQWSALSRALRHLASRVKKRVVSRDRRVVCEAWCKWRGVYEHKRRVKRMLVVRVRVRASNASVSCKLLRHDSWHRWKARTQFSAILNFSVARFRRKSCRALVLVSWYTWLCFPLLLRHMRRFLFLFFSSVSLCMARRCACVCV